MHRYFFDYLTARSPRSRRVPLIVRGARQVGKSHTIRAYGKACFEHLAEINLELAPQLKACFATPNPVAICKDLEALLNVRIVDEKTLLFIDEIQDSPEALLSLRAFKEQRPGLDIVAAGSLLEFALDSTTIRSFPVGRIDFAWMHPMSFREFLLALGEDALCEQLAQVHVLGQQPLSLAIHTRLLGLVREYFVIGGMPEVVEAYKESKSYLEARKVQTRLMLGYFADFVKYGARYDHRKLQSILNAVPRLVGKAFKFSQVDPNVRARDLKQPLLDLEKAGLVRLIRATHGNGAPLAAEEREGYFKVQSLDIGLLLNMLGLNLGSRQLDEALFANEGALAEQFVGQELLAYATPDLLPQLHYWHRDVTGSRAEVDFLVVMDGQVIPVEVKAGKTGGLKSARLFMSEKKSPVAVRISQQELSFHDGILSLPFYLCAELPRFLAQLQPWR